MSKEIEFFVYLVERYGASKGKSGGEMLRLFDDKGLTDYIIDMYELYHAERLENALSTPSIGKTSSDAVIVFS